MSDQEKYDMDYERFKSYEREANGSGYQDNCWGGWDSWSTADQAQRDDYHERGWYW